MQGLGTVVDCTGEGKKIGNHQVQALNLEGNNRHGEGTEENQR